MSVSRRTFVSTAAIAAAADLPQAHAAVPAPMPTPPTDVDRGFVRLREGLVHYRSVGQLGKKRSTKALPLYLAHAGPGSSSGYPPMLLRLAGQRSCIAPDSLGAGDSAKPEVAQPDVAYYADSVLLILDALGIEQIDYCGAHTGAHIGTELALRAPGRVRRLILDGVTLFSDDLKKELLVKYAPPKVADDAGGHFPWAWQFIRDMGLFFPHYARDDAHRMHNAVPPPESTHRGAVEVLKNLTTYHMGYHAVFRHDIRPLLPRLKLPVLCMASESDPVSQYLDESAALVPGAKKVLIPRAGGLEAKAAAIEAFLNA